MKDDPETTDWLHIEWVVNEDGEVERIIDPEGFGVPLNLTMRV